MPLHNSGLNKKCYIFLLKPACKTLPGQLNVLQFFCSIDDPVQFESSWLVFSFKQTRVLMIRPLPHVTLHLDQTDHSFHWPSIKMKVNTQKMFFIEVKKVRTRNAYFYYKSEIFRCTDMYLLYIGMNGCSQLACFSCLCNTSNTIIIIIIIISWPGSLLDYNSYKSNQSNQQFCDNLNILNSFDITTGNHVIKIMKWHNMFVPLILA